MRYVAYIVSTLIAPVFFSAAVFSFEWHCSSTDGTIRLDVPNSLNAVQEGELHGSLLADHPVIRQASLNVRCTRQGSESATLLLCTSVETDRLPLKAYIFRGVSRPEWPRIFARVYLDQEVLADLMPCE